MYPLSLRMMRGMMAARNFLGAADGSMTILGFIIALLLSGLALEWRPRLLFYHPQFDTLLAILDVVGIALNRNSSWGWFLLFFRAFISLVSPRV